MNIDKKSIMVCINNLKEKGLLEVRVDKNKDNKLEEYIFLDILFNKVFLNIINEKDEEKDNNIYSIFEKELGRTLSPMEYELISGWIDANYSEEIIIAALKEAVFSGVSNFRYIDKILFEWNKKNIKKASQIKENKKEFESKKEENIEVPDYDWLNNE